VKAETVLVQVLVQEQR